MNHKLVARQTPHRHRQQTAALVKSHRSILLWQTMMGNPVRSTASLPAPPSLSRLSFPFSLSLPFHATPPAPPRSPRRNRGRFRETYVSRSIGALTKKKKNLTVFRPFCFSPSLPESFCSTDSDFPRPSRKKYSSQRRTRRSTNSTRTLTFRAKRKIPCPTYVKTT